MGVGVCCILGVIARQECVLHESMFRPSVSVHSQFVCMRGSTFLDMSLHVQTRGDTHSLAHVQGHSLVHTLWYSLAQTL